MIEALVAGKVQMLVATGQFNVGYCNTLAGCSGRRRGRRKPEFLITAISTWGSWKMRPRAGHEFMAEFGNE